MWTLSKTESCIAGVLVGLGIGWGTTLSSLYVWNNQPDHSQEQIKELQLRIVKTEDHLWYIHKLLDSYRLNMEYIVDLSAYTARREECDDDPTNTAIMERPVSNWTVAVSHDLKHLLGKRVYIKGFGVRRVNDLMNGRFTRKIDILVPTVKRAREIGIQTNVRMVVLEPELLFRELVLGEEI